MIFSPIRKKLLEFKGHGLLTPVLVFRAGALLLAYSTASSIESLVGYRTITVVEWYLRSDLGNSSHKRHNLLAEGIIKSPSSKDKNYLKKPSESTRNTNIFKCLLYRLWYILTITISIWKFHCPSLFSQENKIKKMCSAYCKVSFFWQIFKFFETLN